MRIGVVGSGRIGGNIAGLWASLDGKTVVDTTNHFGPSGLESIPDALTAAQFNQRRMPGARLVKAFNTLTAGFQASEAGRPSGALSSSTAVTTRRRSRRSPA